MFIKRIKITVIVIVIFDIHSLISALSVTSDCVTLICSNTSLTSTNLVRDIDTSSYLYVLCRSFREESFRCTQVIFYAWLYLHFLSCV